MSDLETRSIEQLPEATSVSPDALTAVQEPGGPVVRLKIRQLLGRLISTEEATPEEDDLQALLDYPANSVGLVFADPDPAKNGWYRKTGASGSGNWVQFEKLSADAAAEVQALVEQAETAAETAATEADRAVSAALDAALAIPENETAFLLLGGDPLLAGAQLALVNEEQEIVGVISAAAPTQTQAADPVLDAIISIGEFRGTWQVGGGTWAQWDVIKHDSRVWVCHTAGTTSAAPDTDPATWEELPLVERDDVIFSDQFLDQGVLVGRLSKQGIAWDFTGDSRTAGNLGTIDDGYLTCPLNGYYVVNDLPGILTSIEIKSQGKETIAISPLANFSAGFSQMWHINWDAGFVPSSLSWTVGASAAAPIYRLFWGAGLTVDESKPTIKRVEIRGRFIIGYLDDQLAFVEMADVIGTLCGFGNAKSFYVQDHAETAGVQRKYFAVVRAA